MDRTKIIERTIPLISFGLFAVFSILFLARIASPAVFAVFLGVLVVTQVGGIIHRRWREGPRHAVTGRFGLPFK